MNLALIQFLNPDGYYNHLIFDNSLAEGGYFFSRAAATAPSRLESLDNRLPVSGAVFFSPPNSLKLSWLSEAGGDWCAEILTETWFDRMPRLSGDTLSFWCYAAGDLFAANMPLVSITIKEGPQSLSVPLAAFTSDLPAGCWRQIKISLADFSPADARLDFSRIEKVVFSQGASDGLPHTLYLDEIKILDAAQCARPLEQIPTGLTAVGYDCHIDLSWDKIDDPELAYVQVYRASSGQDFQPIGIQNREFCRYSDYLGLPAAGPQTSGRAEYFYKITAVGYDYSESSASETASAATRPLTDEELLDMVQLACFRYYWESAHPDAGLALESIPGDENLVALGASGFGVMALVAAAGRGFIPRPAAAERMLKIITFLEKADRFHGVWPHFLDGRTGRVIPLFGKYDNGGDLVETAFMVQGLLAARQFFDQETELEAQIRVRITALWEAVEWDWYRRSPESDFLYWHWSPDYEWYIDHPLIGWNETMIVYLLAIASPTHPVPASMFYSGWASQSETARNYRHWGQTSDGEFYTNGQTYFGIQLPVAVGSGGPLFFTHYSFMGFDPRRKRDQYCDYFENNQAIARINQAHCIANPGNFQEYGPNFWGLTASFDHTGYLPHEPSAWGDNGTITPTGALASFPYTPAESLAALKNFYYNHGAKMWGILGFRDAYNPTVNFVSNIFMGLNQAPITVMIENHRSGLVWERFMANPEMAVMLERIGFKTN